MLDDYKDKQWLVYNLFMSDIKNKCITHAYLIDENNFDAIITIHAPYKTVNYDGPAELLAQKISEFLGYPPSSDIGYPTPGSFGTYCGVERKILTITIEINEEEDMEKLNSKFHTLFEYLKNEY